MKKKRTNPLKSSTKTIDATNSYLYLPDECWESVFRFLINDDDNQQYLKSLSVVSKQLLSIANSFKSSLTVHNPTRPLLHHLLQRFANITSLDLSCYKGDVNKLIHQISRLPMKVTSLNLSNQPNVPTDGLHAFSQKITTLTSLTCSNIHSIDSTDLFLIAHCFPLLEELDLGHPGEFGNYKSLLDAIKALSLALSKLRKVNLSRHCYLNDQSIHHLFKNCKVLEEAILFECYGISNDGVAFALRERPKLWALSFSNTTVGSARIETKVTSDFCVSLASLKCLTCLDLSSLSISNDLLSSIALEGLPLRRLVLQNCYGYTYLGIFCLLFKCRSIQHLDLQKAEFLIDHEVVGMSLFLGDLVSINLSECRMLTNSALFALVKNCPSLSDIKMEHTSIGINSEENSNSLTDLISNPQLKSLYLARNSWLRDESLIMFASIFPNLQLLDLSDCDFISEEVICQVLRRCCKIRHLSLVECNVVKLLGLNFEISKVGGVELDIHKG